MAKIGELSKKEARIISNAYGFFRVLINALRLRRGNALDLELPPISSWEYHHLACRMGYTSDTVLSASQKLMIDFNTHSAHVYEFTHAHFGKTIPMIEDANPATVVFLQDKKLSSPALKIFKDKNATYNTIAICSQKNNIHYKDVIMPLYSKILLLSWTTLERSGIPDRMLRDFSRIVVQILSQSEKNLITFYKSLLAQPARLDILLAVLMGSRYLSEEIIKNTDLINYICDRHVVQKQKSYASYIAQLNVDIRLTMQKGSLYDSSHVYSRMSLIRNFRKKEILRIITRDLCLHAPLKNIVSEISDLACSIIQMSYFSSCYDIYKDIDLIPNIPIMIFAFGKCGARELNYSSDIDLMCVYKQKKSNISLSEQKAIEIFKRTIQYINKYTADGRPYRVDLRLRPYGNAGSIIQTTEYVKKILFTQCSPMGIASNAKIKTSSRK